jgi:hypothetical protein
MRTCLAILACIFATAPAWAVDSSSVPGVALSDPDTAFRTPGGEVPAVSAIERSAPGPPMMLHFPPTIQVAQATGTSDTGKVAGTSTEELASEGPYSGGLWSRSTMTGDWGGFRNTMAEMGITLESDFTQIGQGVVSGGLDIGWKYQGRGQITLKVATLGFHDTQGFEAYNIYVTPWTQLTPAFQIVRPSQQRVETAYVVGFRLRLVF